MLTEPLRAFEPLQLPVALHDVAYCELQVSVLEAPFNTVVGEALSLTLGAGGGGGAGVGLQ